MQESRPNLKMGWDPDYYDSLGCPNEPARCHPLNASLTAFWSVNGFGVLSYGLLWSSSVALMLPSQALPFSQLRSWSDSSAVAFGTSPVLLAGLTSYASPNAHFVSPARLLPASRSPL